MCPHQYHHRWLRSQGRYVQRGRSHFRTNRSGTSSVVHEPWPIQYKNQTWGHLRPPGFVQRSVARGKPEGINFKLGSGVGWYCSGSRWQCARNIVLQARHWGNLVEWLRFGWFWMLSSAKLEIKNASNVMSQCWRKIILIRVQSSLISAAPGGGFLTINLRHNRSAKKMPTSNT